MRGSERVLTSLSLHWTGNGGRGGGDLLLVLIDAHRHFVDHRL